MVRRILALCTLCLALGVFAGPQAQAQDPDPLADLALLAASCSPLILPPAENAEQQARNDRAAIAFAAIRDVLQPVPMPTECPVVTTSLDRPDATLGDTSATVEEDAASAAFLAAPAPKTCGDCPSCLSAASCSSICVGGICSPPGAVPARACRVVGSCSDWFGNVTYCCGCS